MNLFNISFMAAFIDFGNKTCRVKVPFWPEIDGFVSSEKEAQSRLKHYVQHVLAEKWHTLFSFNHSETSQLSPLEMFNRQGGLHFFSIHEEDRSGEIHAAELISGEEQSQKRIEPTSIEIPIMFNRSLKEYVNVRIDMFLSPAGRTRSVWIPVLNHIFNIQGNEEIEPQLVKEVNRIITQNDLLQTPAFIENACRIQSVYGRLFHFELNVPSTGNLQTPARTQKYSPEVVGFSEVKYGPSIKNQIYGFQREIELMIEAIDQPVAQPVLILGPPGSGKTALWRKFVSNCRQLGLSHSFWESVSLSLTTIDNTSPDECLQELLQWVYDKQTVFHFGNLWELDQLGKSSNEDQSIADIILPSIQRGILPAVMECTPEQYSVIAQNHPSLLTPFLIVKIPDSSPARNIAILSKLNRLYLHGTMTRDAIIRLDSLLTRYSPYESVPGAAVSIMQFVAGQRQEKEDEASVIDEQKITSFFSAQTGLPLFMLDSSVPLDMNKTRDFFVQRVMGQGGELCSVSAETASTDKQTAVDGRESCSQADIPVSSVVRQSDSMEAIPTVLDVIEAIKCRMTKQDGPIVSLLFIGPTGVGKTELAKTLAEFLYGTSKKMVRIDMSEYAEYGAADRLINGTPTGEGILTAAVRAQPLGVVLLDEFEKAHHTVFDLLLQVLGEGRLTDSRGRLADFRNSVIVLTSNLGADNFGRSSIGFLNKDDAESVINHFTTEVSKLVRPELLNRIDRIVPFHPLSVETLHRILERELALLKKRQGISDRPLSLCIDTAVKDELVRIGYNPCYGVRPLRRTLEREILLPLAEALYDVPLDKAVSAHFTMNEGVISLNVCPQKPKSGKSQVSEEFAHSRIALQSLLTLRGSITAIRDSESVEELRNHVIWWLQNRRKIEASLSQKPEDAWKIHQFRESQNGKSSDTTQSIEVINQLLGQIDFLSEYIKEQEVSAVLNWLSDKPVNTDLSDCKIQQGQILRSLYMRTKPEPKTSSFWFASEDQTFLLWMARLADSYAKANNIFCNFWYSRFAPTYRLTDSSPETGWDLPFYPYGITLENKSTTTSAELTSNIIAQARDNRCYSNQYANNFCSFWKMHRSSQHVLELPPWADSGRYHAILLTGVYDSFQQVVINQLSGNHLVEYHKKRCLLWFGPRAENPLPGESCIDKLIQAQASLNVQFKWFVTPNSSPSKPMIPWSSASVGCPNLKKNVDPDPYKSPPSLSELVLADYAAFCYNIARVNLCKDIVATNVSGSDTGKEPGLTDDQNFVPSKS